MVFSSEIFLFAFLPIVIAGYYLVNPKLRNIWLLIASLVFYSWGEPKYVILMIISIAVNYLFGLLIGREERKNKGWVLAAAVLFNVSFLVWFKYLGFIIGIVDSVFHTELLSEHMWIADIRMPIGISFFTFQILSYVIDVYRQDVKPQKNILKLGLYISLFPQLIAGPIVRYIDVAKQIDDRQITVEKLYTGTYRFVQGFVKKVLFSNTLAQVADLAFDSKMSEHSMAMAWIGIICYTLQIYFDFSGYSDMAIGMGRIFGFDFLENFDYPYISLSVKEFWRRWHISLSTWFRDYVYIPLGGNRKGIVRTYIHLLIIFFITGLWHGASYNFIIWGLFHGVFLILERWKLGVILEKAPKVMRHIYTMLVVMVGWVFFRADTLTDAGLYINSMFKIQEWNFKLVLANLDGEKLTILILAAVFATPVWRILQSKIERLRRGKTIWNSIHLLVMVFMFVLSISYMTGSGFNPFIYFRF